MKGSKRRGLLKVPNCIVILPKIRIVDQDIKNAVVRFSIPVSPTTANQKNARL